MQNDLDSWKYRLFTPTAITMASVMKNLALSFLADLALPDLVFHRRLGAFPVHI